MGFRFRRTLKLAPWLRLNLNKGSLSLRLGGRGAGSTVSTTGSQTKTVGIPGSGFSWTKRTGPSKAKTAARVCQECAAKLRQADKFCPKCGAKA